MTSALSTLNEKINKQIIKDKGKLFTKEFVETLTLALFFSLLAFSVKYQLGAVFILPVIAALLQLNKKLSLYVMFLITGLTAIIDYHETLAVVIAFSACFALIHRENKQKLNYLILVLVGLLSYCLNTIINNLELRLIEGLFIGLFIFTFYTIYVKALEINHEKKQFLFKEDIIAIITVLFNIIIGLFSLNFDNINIGLMTLLFSIMVLGTATSKLNVLLYSLITYFVLTFSGYKISGSEIIPFIGLFVLILPQETYSLKTFCFYITPVLIDYIGYLSGDLWDHFFSNGLVTTVYYLTSYFFGAKFTNILVPKHEDAKYYQIYVENLREDVSQRLLNFAELFNAFANKSLETNSELVKFDEAIDELTERHCKNCLKKELCLNCNHIKTYNYFSQILKEGEGVLTADKKRFLDLFGMYCLDSYAVINSAIELNQEYMLSNKKQNNTNLIFQSQLQGLAQILQEYALEVNTDYESDTIKIEKLRDKLSKLGLNISYIKVNNTKRKNLDIDFGIRDYEEHYGHLICNLVDELFKEEAELRIIKTTKSFTKLKVSSKQIFELEFGTSYIGKDGSRISGDNFLKCERHNGNTVIALSDGMGTGYSAHIESKSTLELLNKMLMTGADDRTAVAILNTLLSLKEYNERYSTLDYVTINKSKGAIDFYKIGSAPSFIIRGNKVIRIDNANLPIGVNAEIDKVSCDLMANDILVMVSDGVVERFNNINKFEKTLVQIIRTSSIQMAHDIIRTAITEYGGKIPDDMTAIVVKINPCKNQASA